MTHEGLASQQGEGTWNIIFHDGLWGPQQLKRGYTQVFGYTEAFAYPIRATLPGTPDGETQMANAAEKLEVRDGEWRMAPSES